MRRLTAIVGTLALAALVLPTPTAEASHRITVTASGEISLWDCLRPPDALVPCESPPEERHLWAPVSLACSSAPCPGPTFTNHVDWALGDPDGDPDSGAPCNALGSADSCHITAYGSLGSIGLGTKVWCGGPSIGQIDAAIDLGDTHYRVFGPGPLHVGPHLTWEMEKENDPNAGGVGVGEMILLEPDGGCGLDPTDGFAPAHSFTVVLNITWHADPA